MKPLIFKLSSFSGMVLSGLVSATALAADPAPTTAPVVSGPTVAASVAPTSPRVEIFAFTPVDKAAPAEWIGRGIRENLQSDVSKTGATLILPVHAAGANDDQIAAAKQDHADLAVTGTYQVIGDQIRVNAHLVDVGSNSVSGGFSATGAQHDLFQVEDALGEQMRKLLPRPVTAVAQAQNAVPLQPPQMTVQAAAPTVIYEQEPTQVYSAPVVTYQPNYYPDYGYDGGYYGYPYGLGYPFGFYGGIGIYRGGYYGHEGFRGGVGFRGVPAHVGVGVGIRGGGGGGGFHGGGGHR